MRWSRALAEARRQGAPGVVGNLVLGAQGLRVGRVHCEDHVDLCSRFGVTGHGALSAAPLAPLCDAPHRLCSDRSTPVAVAEPITAGTQLPTDVPQLMGFYNGTFVAMYKGAMEAQAIKAWILRVLEA